MSLEQDQKIGSLITTLIQKENLDRETAKAAFCSILRNETTEMQQGAFLAALTAKGESEEEVAGAWEAIYELDTVKVSTQTELPVVDNCGTGMDSFKTFNISTAASLVAASGGIPMARHGARAITSSSGTVDMAEALGVDVNCSAETVVNSINQTGIGLFNGMSPQIHPMALGRILSQICFGSTLNIAASLANPALPMVGIRGVYAKDRIMPVIKVMKEIGYKRAMVFFGQVKGTDLGMDEASVCGTTHGAELKENGEIESFTFEPNDFGLSFQSPDDLSPKGDLVAEAKSMTELLRGKKNGARKEAVALNAGLIYYVSGKTATLDEGVQQAVVSLEKGLPFETLYQWVSVQNTLPEKGLQKLQELAEV